MPAVKEALQTVTVTPTATYFKTVATMSLYCVQYRVNLLVMCNVLTMHVLLLYNI